MKVHVWINPLTGSDTVPEHPGDLLTAAIAYWEDVLMEWRTKRPRKPADRAEKQRIVAQATERLRRFRGARDSRYVRWNPSKLTLTLARDDLAGVQRVRRDTAA